MWPTITRRFFTIWRIECSSQPISSRDWLRMSVVRFPLDTSSASIPSFSSGSAMSLANAISALPGQAHRRTPLEKLGGVSNGNLTNDIRSQSRDEIGWLEHSMRQRW